MPENIGRAGEIRTPDLLTPSQARQAGIAFDSAVLGRGLADGSRQGHVKTAPAVRASIGIQRRRALVHPPLSGPVRPVDCRMTVRLWFLAGRENGSSSRRLGLAAQHRRFKTRRGAAPVLCNAASLQLDLPAPAGSAHARRGRGSRLRRRGAEQRRLSRAARDPPEARWVRRLLRGEHTRCGGARRGAPIRSASRRSLLARP